MKKTLLYLSLFVLTAFNANGQFKKNWEKSAGSSYPWFATATANINSCAYNPVTNKLYVANRDADIYIINPVTGVQEGTLNKTGVGVPLSFHKIRVTSTGEIFAVSLRTSTLNGNTFIYYWANEESAPVLLGDATTGITLASERSGDAFGLSGSGNDVVMYLGGSGTSKVQVVSKSGGVFSKYGEITLATAGSARSSISPVTTGLSSDIFISGATVSKKKISAAGAELKLFADGVLVGGNYTALNSISRKFASIEYFTVGTKEYLAATGSHDSPVTGEGQAFHVYDISDINNVKLLAEEKLTNFYNPNTGPTADIAINKVTNGDGSFTVNFFQLVNHNGLASYTLEFKADGTLPVSLSSFVASNIKGRAQLTWSTSSESNNKGFEILRSTDGANFEVIGSVSSKALDGNSNEILTYDFVDENPVYGVNYYRLNQIDLNGASTLSEIKTIQNTLGVADVSVYPNPVTDFVNIKTRALTPLNIYLYDLTGRELIRETSAEATTALSLAGLHKGIYVLKVYASGSLLVSTKIEKK